MSVTLHPDGTYEVTQLGTIKASKQKALRDERLHQADLLRQGVIQEAVINEDSECSELIVYHAANYAGDQICFKGTGDAAMNDYWIISGVLSWDDNVYSWDSISAAGYWKNDSSTACAPTIASGVSRSPTTGCWAGGNSTVGFLHKTS